MAYRPSMMAMLLAGAWLSGAPAHGQTAPELRSTIDEPALQGKPVVAETPALADPNLAVEDAPVPHRRKAGDDPYAPQGVGSGGLRLYPSITVGSLFNSNVAASPAHPRRDVGLSLRPSLRVDSDWVRHSWTAGASGDFTFYGGNSDLNSRDLDVFEKLRLDVRRDTIATFDASYSRGQTGLEDSDVPATAIGYRTDHTVTGIAGVAKDFGGFETKLRGGATWKSYDNVKLVGGGVENNADRDYIESLLSVRATFTDPPVFKPYIEASYTPRTHQRSIDRNGLRRDSNGYGLAAGMVLDDGPIWSGDMAVTYLRRSYDDPALSDNQALGLTGAVTWSPTELTRVVLSLDTSLAETAAADSPGSRNWSVAISANQSLRDNLDLTLGGGASIEEAQGGTDVTYDASAGLSWKLNPMLAWTADYDFTWLDAAAGNRDYTVHKVFTGLTLSR